MNKLLIGLLIAAAGAGAYFLLQKKKDLPVSGTINKELLIGAWKPAGAGPEDSSGVQHRYEFLKDGTVLHFTQDSAGADSSRYEWGQKDELIWKEKSTDSAGRLFTVLRLTADSLQVQAADSAGYFFLRMK